MVLRMWWTRRPPRRVLERRAADADSMAAKTVRQNETLREQLATARRQREDARLRMAVAEKAATGHAGTIAEARALLNAVPPGASAADWRRAADELRRVLDGWVSDGD